MNRGPVLQLGTAGADVRRLQRLLVEIKLLDFTGIDGLFGPNTGEAVRSFQKSESLGDDGIVGDRTWWVPAGGAGATLASLSGLTTA